MTEFEKKALIATTNNIIDKNLLGPILTNDIIRKQAIEILNVIPKQNDEKSIIKDYENKYKAIDNKIKEMNNDLLNKTDEINGLDNNKTQLKRDIDKLNNQKQDIEIYIKENKDIENFLKEKRERRYKLNSEIVEIEEKKQKMESEFKLLETKKQDNESLVRMIIANNEERKKEIVASYDAIIKQKKLTLEKEIENIASEKKEKSIEIDNLSNTVIELKNEIDQLKREKEDIFKLENKLKSEKIHLQTEQIRVKDIEENLQQYLFKAKEEAKEEYSDEIGSLTDKIEELKEKNKESYNKILKLENNIKPDYTVEKLQTILKEKEEKIKELEEYSFGLGDEREKSKQLLKTTNENLTKNIEILREKCLEYYKERQELLIYKNQIEGFERTLPELQRSKESMISMIEEQRKEIIRLEGKGQSRAEKEKAIQEGELPFVVNSPQEVKIEKIWLDDIEKRFDEVGFKFPKRLLYAFHTSLKICDWSSLSILAGVSGTGKSELPRLYSRYGGINFLPLAVQPNWDGPHSLFGFYNSLEQKFNPTTLLKVLYQAQKGANKLISDYVTIVLLDEMNLAHVELYFSELLSKLESLRGKEEGEFLEIDLGDENPYKINLTNNVMWVGTMNEDETTKSLSDKVIDRGNLINFPKPKELITRKKLFELEQAPGLLKTTWDSWKWTEDNENKLKEIIDNFKSVVESINQALDGSGRAIGHRVWQSIEAYIKNYPLVIENLDVKDKLEEYSQIAFEDALVQKLIPKLRGLETSGDIRENCLDKIEDIIMNNASGIAYDFKNALNNPYGVFVWTSSSYLEQNIG